MPSIDSTLCFRRFRAKQTELSKLYWFHMLNSEIADKYSQQLDANKSISMQTPFSKANGNFSLTVSEYLAGKEDFLNRTRLHLLLVCSANIEAYIKEITLVYLLSKGYRKSFIELNEIGKALGAPILEKDSLPEPLKYAEKLYQVNLGKHRTDWNHYYQLRCVVAHTGGVVTPRTKKDIPSLKVSLHRHVGIGWDELSKALASANRIVMIIDEKVRCKPIKLAEIEKELMYLKMLNELPKPDDVWNYLYENYGLTNTKNQFKKVILKDIYGLLI